MVTRFGTRCRKGSVSAARRAGGGTAGAARRRVEAIAVHQRTAPVRAGSGEARSASTVSPAIIAWPSQTSGATPSGR